MVETAAHLIDNVLPSQPIRQWVLSFPWPLRMLFVLEPRVLGHCLAITYRAIETDLIKRAGLSRASGAKGGMVTLIQRFGSALNLNPDAAQSTCIYSFWMVYTQMTDRETSNFMPSRHPLKHNLKPC